MSSVPVIIGSNLAANAQSYLKGISQSLVTHFESSDEVYREHFARSQREIVQCVDGLKGKAIILGVGAGNDIPLEALAKQFDSVVLIDIDLSTTQDAIQKIPEELRKKFELRQIDLTGGLYNKFVAKAQELIKLPPHLFFAELKKFVRAIKREEKNLQELTGSFVCSSLISSQLSQAIVLYLHSLAEVTYGDFKVDDEFESEMVKFQIGLQISHLSEINEMLAPEGKAYYAEHFTRREIEHFEFDDERASIEKATLLEVYKGGSRVQQFVAQKFASGVLGTWNWQVPRGKFNDAVKDVPCTRRDITEFHITAYKLARKS